MARYDANRGYDDHGIIEPGYGGRSRAIFNYAATSESRVRTEQVVEYGSFPVSHHSPKKFDRLYKSIHGVGDNQFFEPLGPIHHDGPKKGQKSSPKFSYTQGSPQKNILHRDNSPPSRGQYHYKNFGSNESEDEDNDDNDKDVVDEKDVICENGVCYPNPKHMREKDYERAKPKPNSFAHETSYNPRGTYTEKPKDNTYSYSPPSHSIPFTTQPRKDPYYETSHNPPPIKTRPDHHTTIKGADYLHESERNSPVGAPRSPFSTSSPRSPFTSSPRKDHETIDSRRYGKAGSPRVGAMAEQYSETIDCREAAKKYNGVLFNY